jgi:hypothetical protein
MQKEKAEIQARLRDTEAQLLENSNPDPLNSSCSEKSIHPDDEVLRLRTQNQSLLELQLVLKNEIEELKSGTKDQDLRHDLIDKEAELRKQQCIIEYLTDRLKRFAQTFRQKNRELTRRIAEKCKRVTVQVAKIAATIPRLIAMKNVYPLAALRRDLVSFIESTQEMMQDLRDGATACIRITANRTRKHQIRKVPLTKEERAELCAFQRRYECRRWVTSRSFSIDSQETSVSISLSPISASKRRFDAPTVRRQEVGVQLLFSTIWKEVRQEECPDLQLFLRTHDQAQLHVIVSQLMREFRQRIAAETQQQVRVVGESAQPLFAEMWKQVHQDECPDLAMVLRGHDQEQGKMMVSRLIQEFRQRAGEQVQLLFSAMWKEVHQDDSSESATVPPGQNQEQLRLIIANLIDEFRQQAAHGREEIRFTAEYIQVLFGEMWNAVHEDGCPDLTALLQVHNQEKVKVMILELIQLFRAHLSHELHPKVAALISGVKQEVKQCRQILMQDREFIAARAGESDKTRPQ